jgi:hypothetical protein
MPVPGVRKGVTLLVAWAVGHTLKSWPGKTVETDPIAASLSPDRFLENFENETIGNTPTRRIQSRAKPAALAL